MSYLKKANKDREIRCLTQERDQSQIEEKNKLHLSKIEVENLKK
jgi:hypothetical protein